MRTAVSMAAAALVCAAFVPAAAARGEKAGSRDREPAPAFGISAPRRAPSPSPAASPLPPADPREAFVRGNSLYEAGKYKEAADEYEGLVRGGYRGGNLFYNLGNACLKLDRKGKAILYYEKALLLLPRDQDIKSNLDYAISIAEDRIQPPRRSWAARRWDTAAGWFNAREWRYAAAGIFWCLCAAAVALIYAPGARPALVRVAAAAAVLLVVVSAAGVTRALHERRERAVILDREAKIRYGPSEKDVVAFILHEGAVVEVDNEKGEWCQVRIPDGKAGWVEKRQCGAI